MARCLMINRTQGLVLGFFVLAWVMLAVILALSQAVREVTLRGSPATGTPGTLAFLAALLAFLGVLGVGVVRRWRWLFWLILLAFALGLVRVPLAVLQLSGRISPEGPDWYVVLQAVIGVVQVGIASAMGQEPATAGIESEMSVSNTYPTSRTDAFSGRRS